jgi:hypothetical protein
VYTVTSEIFIFIPLDENKSCIYRKKCLFPIFSDQKFTEEVISLEIEYFNPFLHEHNVKLALFIEKPPVTSSNCFETMKNVSLQMKLGTNVD